MDHENGALALLLISWLAMLAYIPLNLWRQRGADRRVQEELANLQSDVSRLLTERDAQRARAFDLEKERDELARERAEAVAALIAARAERDAIYWLRWWVRNAIEAPHHDPARSFYLRWAIAGHFATDFETLHRDLLRVASDAKRTETERIHARAFASELETTHRMPWDTWAETGKPPHNATAVQAAYFAALESWPLLLGTPQAG